MIGQSLGKVGAGLYVTENLKNNVTQQLASLSVLSEWLKQLATKTDNWEQDFTLILAAERALHLTSELMTDVGNLVIDAFVMRDPGGYADIIRVLVEEGALRTEWFVGIAQLFDFRTKLLRDFSTVTSEEVVQAVRQYAPLLDEFGDDIFAFLNQ